jgi:dTMP kinase
MCFIALEGPNGCGKSTQAKLLVAHLRGQGQDVLHLKFPSKASPAGLAAHWILGHVATGIEARHRATMLQSCMLADRYGFVPEIRRHLVRGGFVVVERWASSGLIYGLLDHLDVGWLHATQAQLPAPDLNILLRVPLDVLVSRVHIASPFKRDEYENATALSALRDAYDRLWAANDPKAWVSIDGTQVETRVTKEILVLIAHFTRMRGF